ncbi:purple acid phosphatase 26, phosphatase-under producer 3, PURPLE ACID PHOSPHATASE 26 [Hibiscus trionum]|nr:purple acid phosphatase 26, phosphatase-under producer 3, PURPLE ACID PHOSPHATASE 26 [Hibiscus trionum]
MQLLLFQLVLTSFVFLDSVDNVNAGITSSYLRKEYPAVDMPVDHEVFAAPKGYNAPQQVHMTQGNYDGNAVIISWVTVDEPGLSKLQYGTSDKKYKFTAQGKMTNYTFYEYKSGYIHHVLVDGLKFDTKYYYKIGNGDSAREFWFRTPPMIGPDVPYKFGIIGDLGQTFNSLSTLEHYMESGAECVLFLGDFSYADEYEYNDVGLRWDTFGRFAERSMAYQPWIWIIGNHEIDYLPYMNEVTLFKTYFQRYPTPHLASKSSSPDFYSVRRASAHIIALSSYSPFVKYTPQYIWLSEELERVDRTKTPWLFVLLHSPMYSSYKTHFMEGEGMRVVFEEWFVKHKVDVVFSGHVHAYERSHRFSNIRYNVSSGERYPAPDESAPIYITVGDGGNLEGLADTLIEPQPDYSAFREPSYGHSTLEIMNRTHALYTWHRNDEGKKVPVESFVLHNQYWKSKVQKRKLGKQNLGVLQQSASKGKKMT